MVVKLPCREQIAWSEDVQLRARGDRVKILNRNSVDSCARVVDAHFEEIPLFTLKEEEE